MLELLKGHVGDAAAPFLFVAMFLIIVGGALWLTPRIARWLDRKDKENKSYFDGMLTEDPKEKPEEEDSDGQAD